MVQRWYGRWCRQFGLALIAAVVVGSGWSALPSEAAPSPAPINVGYICSCTGSLVTGSQPNLSAYKALIGYENAQGGVDGHKIKLFVENDQANPGAAEVDVQKLVEQDHIVALASNSSETAAYTSYIDQVKVPVIGTDGSPIEFYTDPDFFYSGQTDDSLAVSVILGAQKVHSKSMAIFYCAESPTCEQLVGPEKTAAAKYGVSISYVTSISASAPNYTAECLAAKQANATTLLILDGPTISASAASSCQQQGYNPTIIISDGGISSTFNKDPGLSNSLLSMQPIIPFIVTNTPGTKAMIKAFNKYQPGLITSPEYGPESVEAWTSGLLLVAAAKAGNIGAGGKVTSQQLFKGLYSLKGDTLGGMSPPLTFKKGVAHPVDCWFWLGTKNGKFVMPYGLSTECAKK